MDRLRKTQKTYSHLASARRVPTEYEVVSLGLLYYPSRGFEVRTKLDAWYATHQRGSLLTGDAWEGYRDPRATTYASYVALQSRREIEVEGYQRGIDTARYEAELPDAWVRALEAFAVLRYPFHGLSMLASYAGQMAPEGTLTIVFALQAADERRRVENIAYRIAMRRQRAPTFAADSRDVWERDSAFQPLRELIERLLVVYDWGECAVATNLAVKPVLDAFFMRELAELGRTSRDPLYARVLATLDEDCAWHAEHALAMAGRAIAMNPSNAGVIHAWCETWVERACAAVRALAPRFGSRALEDPRSALAIDPRVLKFWTELSGPSATQSTKGGHEP